MSVSCDHPLQPTTRQPAAANIAIDPRLFRGLCVYQDVVVDGRTVVEGVRDCQGRWELLAPHMPTAGTILDVGSNFGWFGQQLCRTSPDLVVASVEGDLRSARVQRRALELNDVKRICLMVTRAGTGLVDRFARAGQRFDAAICLAVLHWMPDHHAFLASLGAITERIFIEQPDPREQGAGLTHIRHEIGAIGPYLQGLFPDRPVRRLAQLASHRETGYPREMWMVGPPDGARPSTSAGLEVSTLAANAASWPSRDWWQAEIARCRETTDCDRGRVLFTPTGLQLEPDPSAQTTLGQAARLVQRIPQHRLLARGAWCRRAVRAMAGRVVRRMRHIVSGK